MCMGTKFILFYCSTKEDFCLNGRDFTAVSVERENLRATKVNLYSVTIRTELLYSVKASV